ncbi:MAG: D-hexose-6-phosphate mutarotase [Armatimonadetes bacterium]|nr:D-hexose-6-phosphate mutarotase [Armatimonadota bacterium]
MTNLSDYQLRFPSLAFDLDTTLPRVRCGDNGAVELFLQGAHLSQFETRSGREILFMGDAAQFQAGKAIRGGVPICFPWFGPKKDDPQSAMHGFARTMEWEIVEADDKSLTLALSSDAQTQSIWPHPFRLVYRVEFEGETLRLSMEIKNTGTSAFKFELALHTYYRVADVSKIQIEGLEGKTYLDKTQDYARKVQKGAVSIGGETDRVYLNAGGPITLHDDGNEVRISNLRGWRSTIVWNPWQEKARTMPDLGEDDWKHFVCIESGVVVENAVELAAGGNYQLAIEIEAQATI